MRTWCPVAATRSLRYVYQNHSGQFSSIFKLYAVFSIANRTSFLAISSTSSSRKSMNSSSLVCSSSDMSFCRSTLELFSASSTRYSSSATAVLNPLLSTSRFCLMRWSLVSVFRSSVLRISCSSLRASSSITVGRCRRSSGVSPKILRRSSVVISIVLA